MAGEVPPTQPDGRPYTEADLGVAIVLSAVLGWAGHVAPMAVAMGPGILPLAAVLGLPIALAACCTIAAPVLWWLMRRPITWIAATVWGAAISTGIAAVGIAIARYRGWRASRDPDWFYQIGGGDHVEVVDGILTPYGRWVLAQDTALFVLTGTAVALTVRAVVGPGRR